MEKLFLKTIPFPNLRSLNLKRNLEQEAMMYLTRKNLQEKLTSSLRRIQKPPALLTTTDEISDLVSQYTFLRDSS